MQALSSCKSEKGSVLQACLRGLADPARGFSASSYFAPRGWFAKFVWPDWPPGLSDELAKKVRDFCQRRPELLPIREGTPEWNSVFHGWCSDRASAEAIAKAFHKNFQARLLWVESERNLRGRIAATVKINGLVQQEPFPGDHPLSQIGGSGGLERLNEVPLQLSWKDSLAGPLHEPVSEADREALLLSAQEVFNWAAQRIWPVLNTLRDKLKELYGQHFQGLYVFGSYARPDAGVKLSEDSDLDVALLLSDFESASHEIHRFGQITSDLSLEYGLVISLVPVRGADFKEGRTNFARVISEYAIKVA